jgi:hypothetical protein
MNKQLYISEVKSLLIEFYSQLEFQKKVFISITESLHQTEKLSYIKKIQKEQINDLFGNNEVIVESYKEIFPKRILTESKFDVRDEISKFNDFLFLGMCHKIGMIKEDTKINPLKWVKKKIKEQRISDLPQNQSPKANLTSKPKDLRTTLSPQQQQQYKDITRGQKDLGKQYADAQKPKPETDILTNAINYIRQSGIGAIMESLRSALFSLGGIAVQTVLAFTGAGAIVNDVAWGILTLYDGYQYFQNGSTTSLMNLVIDLICLVTAGTLGSVLGKYVGRAASSVSEAIKVLMEGGAGNAIKGVLNTIKNGTSMVSKWLGESSLFMKNKMGINWVANQTKNVGDFFVELTKELVEVTGEQVGVAVGLAPRAIMRAGVYLGERFEVELLKDFGKIPVSQMEKWVGKTFSEAELNAAKKYVEENGKERPTEEVLRMVDSKFGTHMGDLFALYLDSKKLSSTTKKISSTKSIDKVSQNTANELARFRDPGQQQSRRVAPIQQAGASLLGK